jgi:hypothetical protein
LGAHAALYVIGVKNPTRKTVVWGTRQSLARISKWKFQTAEFDTKGG